MTGTSGWLCAALSHAREPDERTDEAQVDTVRDRRQRPFVERRGRPQEPDRCRDRPDGYCAQAKAVPVPVDACGRRGVCGRPGRRAAPGRFSACSPGRCWSPGRHRSCPTGAAMRRDHVVVSLPNPDRVDHRHAGASYRSGAGLHARASFWYRSSKRDWTASYRARSDGFQSAGSSR